MASKFKVSIVDERFLGEHCIPRGDRIQSHHQGFGWTTERGLSIERYEPAEDRGEYGIVGVSIQPRGLLRNPPSPAQGVAVFEDGSAYYMPDREQFLAFYTRMRKALQPLAVVRLVLEFQTEHDDVQHLFLGGELPSQSFVDYPELAAPAIRSTDPLDVEFFSYRGPLWQSARIYAWRVHEKDGGLSWSSRIVWEG
jgi:hypothetical protein